MAIQHAGTFLLRIEDIDQSRARPEWEAQIYDDLTWLGLAWPHPVMRQSERQAAYDAALDQLWARGLLYPCSCTRADIKNALSAPQEGVPMGPDGVLYPGTCRSIAQRSGPRPREQVLRLDIRAALTVLGDSEFAFTDTGETATGVQHIVTPQALRDQVGDIVLARRDMGTS